MHFDVPGPDDIADIRGLMMITMDPPRHTALRALINEGFTPRQVAKLNERIADMARDLVDRVIEKGQCDFVKDVAGALSSYLIAELLGIPLEDGYRLYELTEITNSGVVGDHNPRATEAGTQMFAGPRSVGEKALTPERHNVFRVRRCCLHRAQGCHRI